VTHGEPRTTTVRMSLTVRQKTSLLTDRHRPLLCTAGVEGSSPFVSTKLATFISAGGSG
jgi:hypothetical protein